MSFDIRVFDGDFRVKNGDVELVTGQNKLIQDILKIAITPAGALPSHPWYGSFISKTLIGSHLDTDIVENMARSQLQNSLENLKKLQQLQLAESFQTIMPDEHIVGISEISVNRNQRDPRLFDVVIKVLNKSFNRVTTTFGITNT